MSKPGKYEQMAIDANKRRLEEGYVPSNTNDSFESFKKLADAIILKNRTGDDSLYKVEYQKYLNKEGLYADRG